MSMVTCIGRFSRDIPFEVGEKWGQELESSCSSPPPPKKKKNHNCKCPLKVGELIQSI